LAHRRRGTQGRCASPPGGGGLGQGYFEMPLRVQIVTAEREVFAEDGVDMVVAPGADGVVGILPRHAPLLTTLLPGVVRVKRGTNEQAMAVGGGFLQVARNKVLILADT